MIDFDPSEEQQLIVETVRQFARNEVRPRARDCDEAAKLPAELLHEAHALGLVANAIDERFGGGGARSAVTGALVAEELAWGDLAIALAILSPSLEALPISDLGSDAQKQRWLPGLRRRALPARRLALLRAALRRGSARPADTRAARRRRLRARRAKCLVPWIEGGDDCSSARRGDAGPQLFRVSRARPRALGHARALHGHPGAADGGAAALGRARRRGRCAAAGRAPRCRACWQHGRVAQGALAIGVARAAYEIARDYAKERQAFGAPIATKQAIAFKLAE